ncbi:3-deoxy-7-phosphoheptulonate synthase [Chytridium lagenaria]|nr:3-deoxy-7-phosphoheptulonate synthase [Chytridium lagenaria]
MEDYPMSDRAALTVAASRFAAESVIKGTDDRLLVIVGPCSIHDVKAAKEYAAKLKAYADTASNELVVIMRGLINDPFMDETFQINKGLKLARGLLLDLNEMGVPSGVEFLDSISPQYIGDLVSWGAIGARTVESQVHRELASGLSVPIGFKNGTDGNLQIAIDAIRAASNPHTFLSVTKQGLSAIVETLGNESCHVILRGGNHGPNYTSSDIQTCVTLLRKHNLTPTVMVDCSHGNSQKQYKRQIDRRLIRGVMIESHLVEGRQDIPKNSVTDACVGWEDTVSILNGLREAVKVRRLNKATANNA